MNGWINAMKWIGTQKIEFVTFTTKPLMHVRWWAESAKIDAAFGYV